MKQLAIVTLIVTFAFLTPASAESVSRPIVVAYCQPTAEPPEIDGVLDDACWTDCQQLGDYVLDKVDELAPQQTVARVCYDDQFIYLAFDCREDDMANTRVKDTGWTLPWYEDSIEIFLDAGYDQKDYAQYGANLLGACNIKAPKDSPDLRMAAGSRADDAYFIEVRIPWAELKVDGPPAGQTWGMNLTRNRYREDGKLNSSWGRLAGSFHKPAEFGQLIFTPRPAVAMQSTLMGWKAAGLNVARIVVENTSDAPVAVTLNVGEGTAKAELQPGEQRELRCMCSLEPGTNRVLVSLTGKTGQVYYGQELPVVAGAALPGSAAVEGVGCFRIVTDKPVAFQGETLTVQADSVVVAAAAMKLTLKASVNGVSAAEVSVEQGATDAQGRLKIAIPDVPDGEVSLTLEALDANEEIVATAERIIPIRGQAQAEYRARIDKAESRLNGLSLPEDSPLAEEVSHSRLKVSTLRGLADTMDDEDVTLLKMLTPELEYATGCLEGGKLPEWGIMNRTYKSAIDGSEQGYVLAVPPVYVEDDGPLPVMVFLHGFINDAPWKPEGKLHNWQQACWRKGVIAVAPYGRGSQGYRYDGERDVMDVLAEVRRDFRVDPDRIYLGGFSMGGSGTMRLGRTRPDMWAAILPCSARMDDKFLHSLRYVPTWMFCGGQERCVEPMTKAVSTLEDIGGEARFTSDPPSGHTTDYIDFDEAVSWLLDHRLVRAPERITFQAPDPSHSKAYWATIDRFVNYTRPAYIDVKIKNQAIDVTSDNVADLVLQPPAELLDAMKPIQLTLNGQAQPEVKLGSSGMLHIQCEPALPAAMVGPTKGADAPSGPIAEVFAGPFLIVYGTGDSAEANKAQAEAFVSGWNDWHHGSAETKADTAVTADEAKSRNLVVIGKPAADTPAANAMAALPVSIHDDRILVADQMIEGESLGVCVLGINAMSPRQYVVFVGGQNADGLKHARGKLPGIRRDYLIVRQGEGDKVQTVAEGAFAADWRKAQPVEKNSKKDSGEEDEED